jgi:hypothetical protein
MTTESSNSQPATSSDNGTIVMQTAAAPRQARPGLRLGQVSEFTLILPLKPGGADRMRERMKTYMSGQSSFLDKIGTVHDLRFVIFDNDTRVIFASTFDGDWDTYIDDFATKVADHIDWSFQDCEGYPGVRSPAIKDYIVQHQVQGIAFYSAYPEVPVREVWKAARVKQSFETLLDAAQS